MTSNEAQAIGASPVSRRALETIPSISGKSSLIVEEVTILPGGSAPIHRHPVPGIIYIIEGEVESAYGDEEPKRFGVGETLQDRADLPHTLFRNCNPNQDLRFIAIYVLDPDRAYVDPIG